MTVTYDEYLNDLKKFSKKHKGELKIYVSPMIDNRWYKKYMYASGATFTEEMHYETEDVMVTGVAHDIQFIRHIPVTYLVTEYYSTDDSKSKYVYEIVD